MTHPPGWATSIAVDASDASDTRAGTKDAADALPAACWSSLRCHQQD
jgi:hypothetical protein